MLTRLAQREKQRLLLASNIINKDNVEIKACPKWARDLQAVDLQQDTFFSRVKMFAKTTNL